MDILFLLQQRSGCPTAHNISVGCLCLLYIIILVQKSVLTLALDQSECRIAINHALATWWRKGGTEGKNDGRGEARWGGSYVWLSMEGVCKGVYRGARAKENAWKAPCCVRKVNMDRTHTLLNHFLLFCLLRSASSSSSSSSSSVPFAITARIGEGGTSREYLLLWIDVRHAVRKDAVLWTALR